MFAEGSSIYTSQTELLTKKLARSQCCTKYEEGNWTGLDIYKEEMMTASPNRCYIGQHKATEKEGDQEIQCLEKEILGKKCGWQDTNTAGGRWRRQHKTELDGDKSSVAYVPSGVTRHKSSQVEDLKHVNQFRMHYIPYIVIKLQLL